MGSKARTGQWLLVAIIAVTALSELAQAGLSLQAGRFRGGQVGRVILTGWLLFQVWDGAAWARWLMAGLFLVAAGLAAFIAAGGFDFPALQERPEVMALVVGFGVVCLAFGLGLASPWVGAYQAARRAS